ncbi:MAG: DapH/DapD/GlmU-related protein [Verrucomicrobiota bacterium]|jgi:NDP-sugar pyrophosphorylase family protein|nr:DapH/DapD/GlmU-related protein [Verrucomicrobiota bacterium]
MFKVADFFDLSQTAHAALFVSDGPAWEALPRIKDYLAETLKPAIQATVSPQAIVGKNISIGEGTIVAAGACIEGPAIIGRNCQIRHNAYIRGHVIIGDNCTVGNTCELKNSLLFNDCQVPHFNYVGDSVLGHHAHLGAGVMLSNLKSFPGNVIVRHGEDALDTGLRKFGAIIGDYTEIGCNSVLNPGSILGRNCVVYPNTNWRGVLAAGHIVKNAAQQEVIAKREG